MADAGGGVLATVLRPVRSHLRGQDLTLDRGDDRNAALLTRSVCASTRVSGGTQVLTLRCVSTSKDPAGASESDDAGTDALDAALAAAITNAALEGIDIEADEQALIRLHQSGGIDQAEFLRRAQALAERKAGSGA